MELLRIYAQSLVKQRIIPEDWWLLIIEQEKNDEEFRQQMYEDLQMLDLDEHEPWEDPMFRLHKQRQHERDVRDGVEDEPWDDYDDWHEYEPLPQSVEWRNRYLNGTIDAPHNDNADPDSLNASWYYEDDVSTIDDEIAAYVAFRHPLPTAPLRADAERNQERLRAGERYYNQNRRTISK